jgi:probable rRNA maturation factor
MELLFIKKISLKQPSLSQIKIWHKKISLKLKTHKKWREASEVTLVFVSAVEGRRLNKSYRKKNYATDILSFAAVDKNSLGELVFCWPVVVRQAKEHGLSVGEEFLYLYIHGLLHLLGYDHEKNDKAARQMYRLQDRLFKELTN